MSPSHGWTIERTCRSRLRPIRLTSDRVRLATGRPILTNGTAAYLVTSEAATFAAGDTNIDTGGEFDSGFDSLAEELECGEVRATRLSERRALAPCADA